MGFFSDLRTNRALRDLTERLETAERQVKALKLEWEDTYDRLRRLMGRVAKRALRDEANTEEEAPPAEPTPNTGDARGPMHGLLSSRQRAIQQDILRRRAGG